MAEIKIEITLFDDRILVEAEPAPKTTLGGVVLPDSAREDIGESNMRVGRVVAVGPGRWIDEPGIAMQAEQVASAASARAEPVNRRQPMDVSVGDRVMYHKARGDKVFLNGGVFLLMGNRDIAASVGEDTEVARLVVRG